VLLYWSDIETYISVEGHKVSKSVHLHLYLKFKNNTDSSKVRECVSLFEGATDIEPCRSEPNWLKCIDDSSYFNCPSDMLSFCYSSTHLVKKQCTIQI